MVRITPIIIFSILSISSSSFASTSVDISPNLRALATADTTDSTKKSDVQATTNTGTGTGTTGTGTGASDTKTQTDPAKKSDAQATDPKPVDTTNPANAQATDPKPADTTDTTSPANSDSDAQATDPKPADTTDTTSPANSDPDAKATDTTKPADTTDATIPANSDPDAKATDTTEPADTTDATIPANSDPDAQAADPKPADTTKTTTTDAVSTTTDSGTSTANTGTTDNQATTSEPKPALGPVDSASGGIPPWIWNQKCHDYKDVDFEGWDIGSQRAPSVKYCCNICKFKPGCVTYSWSDYEGGTCWLKNGRPEYPIYRIGVQSAEIHASKPYLAAFETNTDYEGGAANDIGNVPGSWITACVQPCLSDTRCGAFSWSGFNGGTCWLKRRRGITKSSSVVSGVILKPHQFA